MDTIDKQGDVGRIAVGGVRLEYAWFGPPPTAAPTIVFLHEGLGSLGLWSDFPEAVCRQTGCGGLVYSRRGHGNSDPLERPHDVQFMHHEALVVLPQVLDEFRIADMILLGHSDGGSIALIYTGSGLGKPRGLVLEAPHVFNEQRIVAGIGEIRTRYESGSLRSRLERHHGSNTDGIFRAWADVWMSPEFQDWNIEEFLPDVQAPTLVIQGIDDEYGTERQVEAIKAGIGGPCETLMVPDCGHLPHVDQRDIVEAATTTFVSRLWSQNRQATATR